MGTCAAGRTRTYTPIKDLIYSQASQPIAQLRQITGCLILLTSGKLDKRPYLVDSGNQPSHFNFITKLLECFNNDKI